MVAAKTILVKTSSEIALKSDTVRRYFTKKLVSNIRLSFSNSGIKDFKISKGPGRLFISTQQQEKALSLLQTIPGVHAVALAFSATWESQQELEEAVLQQAKKVLKKGDSFAVRAKRLGKLSKKFSSKQVEEFLGGKLLEEIPGLKVNLSNPNKTVFVEFREKDLFIYFEEISCMRGLPVGVEGNAAFFFKGERKELLAAMLLMYRGCNIYPVVEKKSRKLEQHVNKLLKFNSFREFSFTEQKDLPKLAEERGIQAIATADNSLEDAGKTESRGLIVLRPLLLYPQGLLREKQKLFGL